MSRLTVGVWGLLLSLGVSACGSTALVLKPTAPGQGLIYVYRPGNMLGAFVNGTATILGPGVARTFPLRNDKHVVTVVPEGVYSLTVVGAWGALIANNMPIEVAGGSARFVRCVFHSRCIPMPPDEGARQAARTRENVAGD
jgi:hypothetical protein